MDKKKLVVLLGLAFPMAAFAEEAAVMPQIQVTAQKLDSYTTDRSRTATPLNISLRDTPQSISVVTQQRIEDQALETVTDVVNNVTGVSVNQYETHRAGFTARGFDIDNLQIDGVPTTWDQPWSSGEVIGSLAIYDRVEVVRGATGLMTGAGNPSAAINLVRKRATSKELTGSAEIGIGHWNERRGMLDVSAGVNASGTVRARVVGEYQRSDSWVDLLKSKSNTFYGTVEADLAPRTVLSAGYSRQKNQPKGPMWGGLPYWYTDGSKTNWDVSKTSAADWTRWETEYESVFANLDHSFDNGWKLRASFSHGDRKADSALLYLSGVPDRVTGLGVGAFAGSYITHTRQDDFSLHASGPFQFAGRKHEAAFGYMHSKQKFNADSRAADYAGGYPPVGNFNTWNGAAYPEPTWGAPTFYESSVTKQEAVYGVARFSVTDPLKAIIGARVTNYDKSGVGAWTPAYQLKHDHELTPYAGLVYDINENLSAYASYTDIFQPQNRKDLAGNILDPVVGKSYETGIKGEFLDGRLNASFAVFKIKQDKLAQEAGMTDRDGNGPLAKEAYYRAANGAKSDGFEFELSGELASGWNATAGYSQFKAKDAAGADINSVYPRKLLRVFTTYRLDALTVGGGVNWESRTYTVDPAAPSGTNGLIEQDSFALASLMARYDITKQLSAQVNVNNLFDKKHFGMFAAYGAITYAAPRSVSASLKYRF
ncbi:outer-membrane receptor for ferric coprogen and ferric-rhodotorulic acid [Duganella sp. CF458]|uniref:TonB-dependent siderophore receptor n=1 Tax=Duganella sp. CF458 TaxID=1884368 RepID=UPI0008EDB886|nr:TonB-dependent siderophore receptor [Duganella sp. CF458]SFG70455.1 outer-membrane receptor for ferric coprogen and ferric-rhodotorulic acid [Duganella sp. CF458]